MESKGVESGSNPLIHKDFSVIRGWTVLIFLPVLVALVAPAVWLARDYGTLAVITAFFAAGLQPPMLKPSELLAAAPAPSEPIPVYTGPTRTGAALIAAVAADADQQTSRHRGKKSRVAAKISAEKNDAKSEASDTGKDGKSGAAKPASVRHANAKPDATPKATDAKPAKPKAAAKHSTKPKSTEAKPADKAAAAPRT